ncbi:MAG: hypothetical protein J3Q66DRAFT_42114 [Benniella sp.]|nr:MAG: hypothetical protein J3Q66DRAFT_42114 [Benniella sp.]
MGRTFFFFFFFFSQSVNKQTIQAVCLVPKVKRTHLNIRSHYFFFPPLPLSPSIGFVHAPHIPPAFLLLVSLLPLSAFTLPLHPYLSSSKKLELQRTTIQLQKRATTPPRPPPPSPASSTHHTFH